MAVVVSNHILGHWKDKNPTEAGYMWGWAHMTTIEQDHYSVVVKLSHVSYPTLPKPAKYKVFLERKNAAGGFDRVDWKWSGSLNGSGSTTVTFSNISNVAGQTMRVRYEFWNGAATKAYNFYSKYYLENGGTIIGGGTNLGQIVYAPTFKRGN